MRSAKSILFSTSILVGLLLSGCGGGDVEVDTSGVIPYSAILFYEDFEDYPFGAFPGGGWVDVGNEYVHKEVDIPANHKLLLEGPVEGEPVAGARHYFASDFRPTYIHYKSHPYPSYHGVQSSGGSQASIGYFWLWGEDENSVNRTALYIKFVHDVNGIGAVAVGDNTYPAQMADWRDIDHSFFIELKNINWDVYPYLTFDLWIGGQEIETCIPFLNTVTSIRQLDLFNSDYGRVHYDNIMMADIEVTNLCPHVSANPPGPVLQPLLPPEEPGDEPTLLVFIVQMDAFCRSGPGMEYPKLATFPEGTQLNVNGQNEEGTWWYSEEAGCWISDKVGQFVGLPDQIPVLPSPLPPTLTTESEDEPGKPSGCYKGMDKDQCEANGGTWVGGATEAPYCSCP